MALHAQVLIWYGFPVVVAAVDSFLSNGFLIGCCLLIASILRYYMPQRRRYQFILALCAVETVLWFFISRTLLFIVFHWQPGYQAAFTQSAVIRIVIAFLIIGCVTLLCVLWYSLANQQEAERRNRDAERLAKEAELYKLRQQLQPHFLFNSLNSINALVSLNPVLARTMIQQLSDFLRGTIKREENTWISLEEELQHLQLYLDIEKVRFGHRLHTEIKNKTEAAKLPAMLLQPIVENAIKFGLYDTTGDVCICLTAAMDNNDLVIEVNNPFDAQTSTATLGTGFGLSSVQRRLYLLFARADLLQTAAKDQLFITTIKIPQRDQSNHN